VIDFIRDLGDGPSEKRTCNRCYERRKNKKKNQDLNPISTKKAKLSKIGLSTRTASSILSTNFEDNNLEVSEPFFVQEISEENIINISQIHKMIMINNSNNEECSSTTNPKNVSVMVEHNVIEERRKNLSKYKKLMETALTLYKREIDNHNFVNAFDNLMKPLVKEISECQGALQAHSQQKTWQKSGKLAF
ncbi:1984_t:CDS:2, partial [Gigaspora rosea]